MKDQELIDYTNKTIAELVYPKWDLQKAYNYYNGKMDADQYRYLEENYGIGNPTSVEFIPLIKKHIDALVGEYLGTPILPKVTCKDSATLSKITREKELKITKEVYEFLQKRLNNKLLEFLQNGQQGKIVDNSVQQDIDNLIEDLDQNFISQYEAAAQDVVQYIMQSRKTDIITKLRKLLTDLLITGYTFYRVKPTPANNNVTIEVLDPLNTFIDKNPESPYVKDSYRAVVRKWLTKPDILNMYGKKLHKKDLDLINESWQDAFDTSTYYIRSFTNADGTPQTDGLQAGKEIVPGYPTGPYNTYNYKLIPVYEVEWIKTDKKHVMQRYKTVRIGESIFILYGEDENVIRSQDDPTRCSLSVNGVYFTNRSSEPYSLVLACASLQDKYNLLHFYRDNLIASSGNVGDWIDVSMLPKFLGVNLPERLQKFLAYKKAGIAPIDTSQEGRLGSGQAPINTIFNGYDDTIKAQTVQAIQIAIDSVEQTASSITGVFRERLNGIQQKDAVTNVQTSVNNSFIITKQYYQQMDVVVEEMLLDALNLAKIVFKKGLQGTIILGDKRQRVFTALPEYFTISDYDIHIVTSSNVTRQLEQLKALVPDLIKSQIMGPELIVDAVTTENVPDFRSKVQKAIKKQKEEMNQMQQLQQQNEQMQQELQQIQKQAQQLQNKVEQLNEAKIQLEAQKAQMENEVNWFKARTERTYREAVAEQDAKRTEIEYLQLHDGNPYNDKVVDART